MFMLRVLKEKLGVRRAYKELFVYTACMCISSFDSGGVT